MVRNGVSDMKAMIGIGKPRCDGRGNRKMSVSALE